MNSGRKRLSQMVPWPTSRPQSEEEPSPSCHLSYAISIILVTMCSRHWSPHEADLSSLIKFELLSFDPVPPMKATEGYCLRTESITWGSFIITTFIKVPDERSQEDFLSTHYTNKLLKTEQNGQELCLPIKVLSKGIGVLVVLGPKGT